MMGIGAGKKGRRILSFFILGTILTGSCTKSNEFTIGKDFVESQTRLEIVDTFRVDMSTYLLDSLVTSGQKIAYVGRYEDTVFGMISSESYFDLDYEAFAEIDARAVFDSSAFILEYTSHNYGDTTAPMSVSVHRLTEKIVPGNTLFLYNTSSFGYEPLPMASVDFYPEPHSSDTAVSLRVDAFGEELFDLIRNKDEKVSTEEWFSDYVMGFVITSGNSANKAILGFGASKERLVLKIYFHIDSEDPEKKEITVKMGEASHQFNRIDYDLSNTALNNIRMKGNVIPSAETGNRAYMQGMVGLLPKFQFPSLQNIMANQRWKVLKAELIVEPVPYSYEMFSLPDSLYIYEADKSNARTILRDGEGKQLIASFEFDDYLHEDNRYTFDITNFMIRELSDAYYDYDHSLMIGLGSDVQGSSFERLLVEGKRPPVKLRLYYLSY